MHGGFGRDQTFNNMAAIGPDFKRGFIDDSPMGNIDIVPTVAHILGIALPSAGKLKGRILTESLTATAPHDVASRQTIHSDPAANGTSTLLNFQELDGVKYYDLACAVANGETACR